MSARLCCSYLRVYQPASVFSPAEAALVGRARGHDSRTPAASPFALGLLATDECREVYEKVIDGESYLCPAYTRLRALLGLVSFERSIPAGVLPFFFPADELATARKELLRMQQAFPDVRPPIVQSVWHVPLRWFVCFDDAERRIEHAGDHPTILYQTRIADAQRRVGEALDTLTGGIVHPVIVGMIYELKEWLSLFHQTSILELDYASVATLFEADVLADDHSSADVWSAISALGEGDGMKAGLYYGRVNERWSRPRLRESLN